VSRSLSATLIALAVALVLGACVGAPPAVTPDAAARAHTTVAELERGRTLLVARCGGCHRVPVPADHTARDWPVKLDEMATRAGLHRDERTLLERYLVVMSSR
jgi:hypothetical protein